MHITPLTTALALCLTFLISSVFATTHQHRDDLPATPDLPPAVWQICTGGASATIVHSSSPVQGANGVVLTTGSCINNDTAPQKRRTPSFEVRDSCPTVPDTCLSRSPTSAGLSSNQGWVQKCGASCTSTCYSSDTGGPGPDLNDCQIVFDAMAERTEKMLAIEPNQYFFFHWGTCGTTIKNQIAANPTNPACPQRMVYDFTDWLGVAKFLASNCQAAQGARGGECIGDSGIYTSVPDFYIRLYAI